MGTEAMHRAGAHLRRFRIALRIGLREASRVAGVSAVTFGEWERGLRSFDFESVSALLMSARPHGSGLHGAAARQQGGG